METATSGSRTFGSLTGRGVSAEPSELGEYLKELGAAITGLGDLFYEAPACPVCKTLDDEDDGDDLEDADDAEDDGDHLEDDGDDAEDGLYCHLCGRLAVTEEAERLIKLDALRSA